MEIEVGEYVRTKRGLIARYLGFEKDNDEIEYSKYVFDGKIYWYYEYYNEYVYKEDWEQFKENIVKHSPNIIDLIEVGDYVNGYRVESVSIETNEVLLDHNGFGWRTLKDGDRITTHEQFASVEYKVEEE